MMKLFRLYGRIVGILIGSIFIVVGLLFFKTYDPDAYDVKTMATIVQIDEEYDIIDEEYDYTVYVDYIANGKEYKNINYGAYNSSMDVGDEVELYYMSSDPTQIATPDKDIAPYIGLGAAVIGAGIIVFSIIKRF